MLTLGVLLDVSIPSEIPKSKADFCKSLEALSLAICFWLTKIALTRSGFIFKILILALILSFVAGELFTTPEETSLGTFSSTPLFAFLNISEKALLFSEGAISSNGLFCKGTSVAKGAWGITSLEELSSLLEIKGLVVGIVASLFILFEVSSTLPESLLCVVVIFIKGKGVVLTSILLESTDAVSTISFLSPVDSSGLNLVSSVAFPIGITKSTGGILISETLSVETVAVSDETSLPKVTVGSGFVSSLVSTTCSDFSSVLTSASGFSSTTGISVFTSSFASEKVSAFSPVPVDSPFFKGITTFSSSTASFSAVSGTLFSLLVWTSTGVLSTGTSVGPSLTVSLTTSSEVVPVALTFSLVSPTKLLLETTIWLKPSISSTFSNCENKLVKFSIWLEASTTILIYTSLSSIFWIFAKFLVLAERKSHNSAFIIVVSFILPKLLY